MKYILVIACACAGLRAEAVVAGEWNLRDIPPLTIQFGQMKELVMTNTGLDMWIRSIEESSHKRSVTLNAIEEGPAGKMFWCRREGTNSYSDDFRVSPVSSKDIEKLTNSTIPQLQELLGQPAAMQGPMDHGAVYWTWNICNGKKGSEFEAIDVVAGFRPNPKPQKLFFLLMNTAHRAP